MSYFFEIVIILILIILNGILAMSEFAIVSAKKPACGKGQMTETNVLRVHLNSQMNPLRSSQQSRLASLLWGFLPGHSEGTR